METEIVALVLGFVLGFVVGGMMMLTQVRKVLFKLMVLSSPGIKVSVVPELATERINESIMLYEESAFLCQGNSIEEVAKNFAKINNAKIAEVLHDQKSIWFVDGEVLTSLDQA